MRQVLSHAIYEEYWQFIWIELYKDDDDEEEVDELEEKKDKKDADIFRK